MIDFSKYKRFFVFGCSFTSYAYPTWADILASEMPDAEYYNFGKSGCGNLLISNRVAQANSKFKFTDTDLVIVMWTSAYREDRYYKSYWIGAGNVYNSHVYDKNFVKNYCDPEGFLIRDMALIELTTNYLKTLPCDTIHYSISSLTHESNTLMSSEHNPRADAFFSNLYGIYPSTLDDIQKPSVLDAITNEQTAWLQESGTTTYDGHPLPSRYYEFLKIMNLPLTEKSENMVADIMNKINNVKYREELAIVFPELREREYRIFNNGIF